MRKEFTVLIIDKETGEIKFDKDTWNIHISENFMSNVTYTHNGNHFSESMGKSRTTIEGHFYGRKKKVKK